MSLAEIVLTRIDNRLVHGQVGSNWTSSLNVDTIVVVDDKAAMDIFQRKLMESVARAANVHISFYTLHDFVERYFECDSKQKLFLVINDPCVAIRLVEKKVPIQTINIGNMHYARGKVMFNRKVYLSKEEVDAINELIDHGVILYYQDVPGSIIEKVEHLQYDSMRK